MALLPLQDRHQNHAQLLQLACQGNERAIATLMNRHLKQRQMTAKVAWEGPCLHILLEAAQVLPLEPMASLIYKTVLKIQVEKLRSLKVSFRQSGARQLAWSQQRAIAQAPSPQLAAPVQADLNADRVPLMTADPTPLADWLNQKAQADCEPRQPLATADEETAVRFLRFSFSLADTALLPLMSIRQVVRVQAQNILPVPAMPASVVGIYNFRGEMLWLVDLGLQIGVQGVTTGGDRRSSQPSSQPTHQSGQARQLPGRMAIVIQAQGQSIGLLVPDVVDIESHHPKQLQPPAIDLFPPGLLPFMQGYLVRSSSPILDASALIHDRRFQVHAA